MLVLTPSLLVTLGALFLVGIAAGPINPLSITIFQERTPEEMRGRVFGLVTAIAMVAMPAGRLLAGYVIEYVGITVTLIAVAMGYFALAVGVLASPAFRAMNSARGSKQLTEVTAPDSGPGRSGATGDRIGRSGVPLSPGRPHR